MDDPFAILRIPSFTVRKESDLPKLKERAKNLVKQYEKVNKFDKAREVEGAYRAVKEMVIKRANCAGSQAFNKVMVNRPGKSTSVGKAPAKEEKSQGPKNPAEVHFLKAQGAAKAAPAAPVATQAAPSQPYKSREERLKEKIEARRAEAGEKNKRAAAIKEKLAAKRAKKDVDGEDGAMVSASSPAEASPLDNMASPDSSAVDPEDVPQDIQKENGTESEHQDPPDPTDAAGEVEVDFFWGNLSCCGLVLKCLTVTNESQYLSWKALSQQLLAGFLSHKNHARHFGSHPMPMLRCSWWTLGSVVEYVLIRPWFFCQTYCMQSPKQKLVNYLPNLAQKHSTHPQHSQGRNTRDQRLKIMPPRDSQFATSQLKEGTT